MPVKSFRIDDILSYECNRNDVGTRGGSCKWSQISTKDSCSNSSDVSLCEPADLTVNRQTSLDAKLKKRNTSSPVSKSEGKTTIKLA